MAGSFAEFFAVVLSDNELQAELRRSSNDDPDGFADAVVAAGSARGFVFDRDEVDQAATVYRRAWIERWIT